MGFLKNFLSAQENGASSDWQVLDSTDQINTLLSDSHLRPVAIFKHSTTCGISHMAKFQLENGWDFTSEDLDFYYLDLLRYRPVSNAVAEQLKVVHQSPQLIVLRQGKVVFTTSHHGVSGSRLRQTIDALKASAS